ANAALRGRRFPFWELAPPEIELLLTCITDSRSATPICWIHGRRRKSPMRREARFYAASALPACTYEGEQGHNCERRRGHGSARATGAKRPPEMAAPARPASMASRVFTGA